MSLDAWPGEREERDDRLIETGAIPDYRGRIAGRTPALPVKQSNCVVCTVSIPELGLCDLCKQDHYDDGHHVRFRIVVGSKD